MLTRFFRTSKPIHFVIMILFTLIAFLYTRISNHEDSLSLVLVLEQLGFFIVVLVSFFVLDFLVSKNNLTKRNSYKILIFGLLLVLLPMTFQINNILVSNVFVLFALRRIISLRSNLNVKKKLFDAAFWIGIASLFYFWSILFFILIITALIVYSLASAKNWIIPFMGLSTVAVITVSYLIIMPKQIELSNYLDIVSFDFTKYNRLDLILGMTIVISLGIWALFFYMKNLKKKVKRQRRSHVLIIVSVLIGMIIILIAPNKTGSEFIFIFAPFSVIIANYLESLKEQRFAELFIWILILTPISFLWI